MRDVVQLYVKSDTHETRMVRMVRMLQYNQPFDLDAWCAQEQRDWEVSVKSLVNGDGPELASELAAAAPSSPAAGTAEAAAVPGQGPARDSGVWL